MPRALLLATALSGIALLTALFFLVSARGFGPFANAIAEPSPAPGAARSVPIISARASSALPPRSATGPERAVDGDTATAWNEAAPGDGTGEWLELELGAPVPVARLLIWNGWQRDDAIYADNNRVQMLRIRAGGRAYTVRLLDRQGPLAVNLPEPVRTRRVRLQVRSVYEGERYDDATISEVQIEAVPAR